MKLLLYLTIPLLLSGCTGGLDTPILQPLTDKVVERYRANDDNLDYLALFWATDELREWLEELDEIPASWQKVTYRQIMDYQDYKSKNVYTDEVFEKVWEEYQTAFPDYSDELYALLSPWREKFQTKDPTVPELIAAYLRYGSSDDEYQIVREYIDSDFIGMLEYLENERHAMLMEHNSTVFEMLEAFGRRETKRPFFEPPE